MIKNKLESIIKKYYLSGLNETSKWKINDAEKTLTIGASTTNQVLSSVIKVDNFTELKTMEFGVNDTTKLLKMINVLDDDVLITENNDAGRITSILMNSGKIEIQYVTADLKFLNDNKVIKIYSGPYPTFEVEIVIDKDFIDTYIAAKSALNDSEYVVFQMNSDNKLEMVFGQVNGGNKTLNTSKVRYLPTTLPSKDILPKSIGYNADYLKEILSANKEHKSSILKISSNTLGFISFTNENITSTYHIKGVAGK